MLDSLFNKRTGCTPVTVSQRDSDAGIFCVFCKFFQENSFEEYLWKAVSAFQSQTTHTVPKIFL